METYLSVRCLYCAVGREQQVVRLVQENGWGTAIFPQRVRTMQKHGESRLVQVPLMPGYVFLYQHEQPPAREALLGLKDVRRILTYGDGTDALFGRDLAFAEWLWRLHGRIDVMQAVQLGDRIEIVDGVFRELRGTIVRMDRRRKTVCVALDTEGSLNRIWLAYEIVEKLKDGGDGRGEP